MKEYLINELKFGVKDSILNANRLSIKSPENLKGKVDYLINTLGFKVSDVRNLINRYPSFFEYTAKAINNKFEDFKELNFSKDEFRQLIIKSPRIVTCSTKAIKDKANILMDKLGLNNEDIKNMIYVHPALVSYKTENMDKTINILLKQGFTRERIIKSPLLLSLAPNSLIVRFAICRFFNLELHSVINNNWFFINEDKLFARLSYLKDKEYPMEKYRLAISRFDKVWAKENVYKKYPFTEEIKQNILKSTKILEDLQMDID